MFATKDPQFSFSARVLSNFLKQEILSKLISTSLISTSEVQCAINSLRIARISIRCSSSFY